MIGSVDVEKHKTIVKSFRIDADDNIKLMEIHEVYKNRHSKLVASHNMLNVHQWTLANTLQVLIRDSHKQILAAEGKDEVPPPSEI